MNPHAPRAFTLADLLIAIASTAALAALAAATLSEADRGSLTAQDQANLMTIAAAAAAWSADNHDLIPGAPGASARELLNDPTATGNAEDTLFTAGLATQPFDWASPLAWGYLTDALAPARRDQRLAYALGVEPVFVTPGAKTIPVANTSPTGPLSVLSDPAQNELSIPFDDSPQPAGIEDTFFAVQTATSYIAAREFLWWGQGNVNPRWANGEDFWPSGGRRVLSASSNSSIGLPGSSVFDNTESATAFARAYRPYTNRVGNPSQKIFLANGTRYQAPDITAPDHDVRADAGWGGAFADTGAWASDPASVFASHAWPEGFNQSGQDLTRISFRHGDETTPRGNTLRFDGSVELMDIHDARDPALWFPRGSRLLINNIPEPYRSVYEAEGDGPPAPHQFVRYTFIW